MAQPFYKRPKPSIQWSSIVKSPISLEKIHLLTSTRKVLSKEGYVFEPLTEREICKKMRCARCGQRWQKYVPPLNQSDYGQQADLLVFDNEENADGDYQSSAMTAAQENYSYHNSQAASSRIQQKHICFWHDGQTFKGVWQCCGGHLASKGCLSGTTHLACELKDVEDQWRLYKTPEPLAPAELRPNSLDQLARGGQGASRGSRREPNRYVNSYTHVLLEDPRDVRAVVALDCEMGHPKEGTSLDSVLIRLSLVDFFTRQPLINRLVAPGIEMQHYNTRYSGVTFAMMRNATRSGEAIRGVHEARELLFKYVDSSTVIVMHGGNNDLISLRMIHPAHKIIDTYILESYDFEACDSKLKRNLKDVCMRRCHISVQDAKLSNGRDAGHDSLEDALACREIVCAWMRQIPDA